MVNQTRTDVRKKSKFKNEFGSYLFNFYSVYFFFKNINKYRSKIYLRKRKSERKWQMVFS